MPERVVRFFDFSGGLNTRSPSTSLKLNEALDLQNINLLPSGGFEKRRGNTALNTTALNSSATLIGLGYYRQADADEFMVAIAGNQILTSPMTAAFTNRTAALTITSGNNNHWTASVMNNNAIMVGGAPDAPITWTGAGDATALGGTPPSGNFGLTANRRFFIGNTTANPSRMAWSILGDPTDWSGSGSGTQDVAEGDGDTLVGAAVLNIDHMLCFKQNSIHDLLIRNAPFPLFPLFRNVGAIGKHAIVTVDGLAYFITPRGRMKATDGTKIYDFPDTIDTTWDALNQSRLLYIQGIYNQRLHQIWWFCSNGTSTTNNYCIVWDIRREAWLRHTSGATMNIATKTQAGTVYGGNYAGVIYQFDVADTYTDASVASPSAINAYWRTGWIDFESMLNSKTIPYADTNVKSRSVGTYEFGWGFNFSPDRKIKTLSQQDVGGLYGSAMYGSSVYGLGSDLTRFSFLKGTGKYVQFFIRNGVAAEGFSFNGFELPVQYNAPAALKL